MGGLSTKPSFINHDPENMSNFGPLANTTDIYTTDLEKITLEPILSLSELQPYKSLRLTREQCGCNMEISDDGLSGRTLFSQSGAQSQVTVRWPWAFLRRLHNLLTLRGTDCSIQRTLRKSKQMWLL